MKPSKREDFGVFCPCKSRLFRSDSFDLPYLPHRAFKGQLWHPLRLTSGMQKEIMNQLLSLKYPVRCELVQAKAL
jgi:hypothetical protein